MPLDLRLKLQTPSLLILIRRVTQLESSNLLLDAQRQDPGIFLLWVLGTLSSPQLNPGYSFVSFSRGLGKVMAGFGPFDPFGD